MDAKDRPARNDYVPSKMFVLFIDF